MEGTIMHRNHGTAPGVRPLGNGEARKDTGRTRAWDEGAAAIDLYDDSDPLAGLEAFESAEMGAIDRALHLILAGEFGVCSRCHGPIEVQRLETLPETTLCASCADASRVGTLRDR